MTIISFLRSAVSQGKAAVVIGAVICLVIGAKGYPDLCFAQGSVAKSISDADNSSKDDLAGPHQRISPEAPQDSGFWSFAISVPNIISRSGQPTMVGFRWLKDNGWKSVVDLRLEEDDSKIEGFKGLNFNYLALPIVDNTVPTEEQVQKFLDFVSDSGNQPAHVHCYMGVGRTGIMIALYRYMVQDWPMDKAIRETKLFGGLNKLQEDWLISWAQTHKPGSYENSMRP